jgi:acyl carrier protein
MDREELKKLIIELVITIQNMSGRSMPSNVTEKTVPIGGLLGFDSLNGLELTMMLPAEVQWPEKNLCVSDDGRKALSIEEIVERLIKFSSKGK